MRRDSIFYALFQRSPSLLFELLENSPNSATQYRFESVAVKEPKFEIDGVFLPPESQPPGTIFFAEVRSPLAVGCFYDEKVKCGETRHP
jgi:predicted transposase YdaD